MGYEGDLPPHPDDDWRFNPDVPRPKSITLSKDAEDFIVTCEECLESAEAVEDPGRDLQTLLQRRSRA